MSLTFVKQVQQNGKHVGIYATVNTDSAGSDAGTLVDFSADVDPTPFGGDSPIYTALKVKRITLAGISLSRGMMIQFKFDASGPAGADVIFAEFPTGADDSTVTVTSLAANNVHTIDFTDFPEGGLKDPRETAAYTGDIQISRLIFGAGGANSDQYMMHLTGELIP